MFVVRASDARWDEDGRRVLADRLWSRGTSQGPADLARDAAISEAAVLAGLLENES